MVERVALITGVTGQDGAFLAELLIAKDYVVHGVKRHTSSFSASRIDHLLRDLPDKDRRLILHDGDLTDTSNLIRIVDRVQPTEIYNLAAQSHALVSRTVTEFDMQANGFGPLRLLEAIRILGLERRTRFCLANSAELFGGAQGKPCTETTPFRPRHAYAAAKLYAFWITVNYREAYGIHASNGILFNHEGPTRGETFVTRKITRAVAAIELGMQDRIELGNLDAKRDWGHARDFVEGMWLMLQRDRPDDYVLATGEEHSVREFVELAFASVGRTIEWRGTGAAETGIEAKTGATRVTIDPRFFRSIEAPNPSGDATKARTVLGWRPKIGFRQLVEDMVGADLEVVKRQQARNRLS